MSRNVGKKYSADATVSERVSFVMSLAESRPENLLKEIKRYVVDRSPTVRAATIETVRKGNLRELENSVLPLLTDRSPVVRYTAAECLGDFHEEEGISAFWLYPLLEDSNELVRIETLESLGRIGDKKALPLILKSLDDSSPLVRSYAARFIAELGGKGYLQVLANRNLAEQDEVAKVGLAYALFLLGDSAQLAVLLDLLSSDNYRVRCASANSLSALDFTPAQLQTVLRALSYAGRNALEVADRSTMSRVRKELDSHD